MNVILVLLVISLLIGAGLVRKDATPEQILLELEKKYVGSLEQNGFGESKPFQLLFKGTFMIATGMAIIGTSYLDGLDISPILWVILGLLILPVKEIIAITIILFEKIFEKIKKVIQKIEKKRKEINFNRKRFITYIIWSFFSFFLEIIEIASILLIYNPLNYFKGKIYDWKKKDD